MKNGIRVLAFLLFLVVLAPSFFLFAPRVSAAEAPTISGVKAAVLYNVENDAVLFSMNADETVYPASSVKLMTAVLAYRALQNRLDETITVTYDMIAGVGGYRIGLVSGETVTVAALFHALLLRGANDAAYVLAALVSGSSAAFVDKMNAYSAELGMTHTLYLNPGGMHEPQMVTTANDTLKIAREFAKESWLLTTSSVVKYVIEATNKSDRRTLYNKNYVVSRYLETQYYYEYARGMNYGSTDESGITCTSSASHNGLTYIALAIGGVELDDKTDTAMRTVRDLLTYGITSFGYREIIDTTEPVCEIPVSLSATIDHVLLYPKNGLSLYLSDEIDLETDIKTSYRLSEESLAAPVKKGQVAGYLNLYYGDRLLGNVELVTGDDVERNSFLYLLDQIRAWSRGRFFRASLIAAAVLTFAYFFLVALVRRKKARHHRRYRF